MTTHPPVAIVGCGFIGRIYAQVLADLEVPVAAVVDSHEPARREVASRLGCRDYATQMEMLAAEPDVTAVGISTPSQFHAQLTIEAVRDGRHVLCEKPLGLGLVDVESMVREAKLADRKLAVGFKMRFEQMYMELRRLVEAGEIGRAQRVIISQHQPVPAQAWARQHGIVNELLIHSIDAACWLMGREPDAIQTRSTPDEAIVSLRFGDDRDALITGAWVEGFPQVGGANDMLVQIVGEAGHLVGIRPDTVIVNTTSTSKVIELPASRYADAFRREWLAFLDWIAGYEHTEVATASDGLVVHRIIDQIENSDTRKGTHS